MPMPGLWLGSSDANGRTAVVVFRVDPKTGAGVCGLGEADAKFYAKHGGGVTVGFVLNP